MHFPRTHRPQARGLGDEIPQRSLKRVAPQKSSQGAKRYLTGVSADQWQMRKTMHRNGSRICVHFVTCVWGEQRRGCPACLARRLSVYMEATWIARPDNPGGCTV